MCAWKQQSRHLEAKLKKKFIFPNMASVTLKNKTTQRNHSYMRTYTPPNLTKRGPKFQNKMKPVTDHYPDRLCPSKLKCTQWNRLLDPPTSP